MCGRNLSSAGSENQITQGMDEHTIIAVFYLNKTHGEENAVKETEYVG